MLSKNMSCRRVVDLVSEQHWASRKNENGSSSSSIKPRLQHRAWETECFIFILVAAFVFLLWIILSPHIRLYDLTVYMVIESINDVQGKPLDLLEYCNIDCDYCLVRISYYYIIIDFQSFLTTRMELLKSYFFICCIRFEIMLLN